jgi:hypothetical protein
MKSARHFIAWMSIAVLTACSKGEVSPATNERTHADEAIGGQAQADTYPHLAEEIVDPDVNEPLTSDEDSVDSVEPEPTAAVVLDDTTGEARFQTVQTSSLRATDAQGALTENIERRNREAQLYASLGLPSPAAADTTTSSASTTATETLGPPPTPAAEASKPATPAPAVDEKKILADPQGQWASTAIASSTYAQTPSEKAGYAAWQATGKPNVPRYSDHPAAWTTKSGDSNVLEWLELGFAKPVHATSVRIRQTAAPGAISKIELIDAEGLAHEIWSGTDDTPYQKDTIGWLVKDFSRTSFVVKGARITLLTARVWGWNEIDAVQLVGEP